MRNSTLPGKDDSLLHYFTVDQSAYLAAFDKKKAGKLIDRLQQGQTLHLFEKNYNLHDVFVDLIKKTGPAFIKIISYSMTDFPMRIISQMCENKSIINLDMVLDYTVSRTPALDQFARQFCPALRYADVHSKILLLKNDNWHIALISSANFTRNNRFENYIVFTDDKTFEIYSEIFKTIYERSNT
jgi:hypothetical protein